MTSPSLAKFSILQLLQKYPDALAAAVCAILVLLGWLCLHLGWINIALLILPVAYVIGGYESTKEGLTTLIKEKELDVDLLMIVAALGAAGLGLWQRDYFLIIDGAVLILIFAISGALESFAMQRTEKNIRSLMAVTPDTARVIVNNREQEIAIAKLQIGDLVLVKPGELIPVDGMIIEGNSNINQATITGESIPVDKKTGDEVFAGTLNGNGVLKLKVHQPPESSLIQRIIRLVEQAQTEAPPSQQFIEKFERGYARVIVLVGLLLMILPPLLWGWNWETTIYRALIFLVVASPCALMASIMPTLLSGIARGAREGILYKNGAQLEKMGKVRAIAFDKTGTLTAGKLQVTEIIPVGGYSENQVLQLAAALESCSEHPIGEAIALAAKEKNLFWQEAVNVQAEVGRGIVGEVAGKKVLVGKATFIGKGLTPPSKGGACTPHQQVSHLPPELIKISDRLNEINTLVWVAQTDKVIGLIAVADTIRPEAARLVKQLKQLNIEQIVLLTGDNQRTANSVAQSLGIDEVYAEVLPEDKLTVIKHLKQKYQNVAMVGDGINDAPALAAATVGIAMGGAGNDVALETADIVLIGDRLEKLARAISLGRRANRKSDRSPGKLFHH